MTPDIIFGGGIAEIKQSGTGTAFVEIGTINAFTITPTNDSIDVLSRDGSSETTIEQILKSSKATINFSTSNINADNLQKFFSGKKETVTHTAGSEFIDGSVATADTTKDIYTFGNNSYTQGVLRFKSNYQKGKVFNLVAHKVNIKPSGDFTAQSFDAEATIEFECECLEADYILGDKTLKGLFSWERVNG